VATTDSTDTLKEPEMSSENKGEKNREIHTFKKYMDWKKEKTDALLDPST